MDRIARITGAPAPARTSPVWRTAVALAAGAVIAATGIAYAAQDAKKAPEDPDLAVLRRAAALTEPGNPEIKDVYMALVFKGSDTDKAMQEHRSRIEARIDAAIESGGMTPEDGALRLEKALAELDDKIDAQYLIDVFGYTEGEAYLAVTRANLDAALKAGTITRAEAAQRLAEVVRGIDLRAEWAAAVEQRGLELRAAVDAGEMTAEDAKSAMQRFERGLKTRFELRSIRERLDAAVEAGEITLEEADERFAAARARIAEADRRPGIDWDAIKRRVEAAVERGDITREEADAIYARYKTRETDSRGDEARDDRDRRAPRHAARVAAAIAEMGVEPDIIREVTRMTLRIGNAIAGGQPADSDAFDAVRARLAEKGLTDEQIDSVFGLAERVGGVISDRGEIPADTHADR